ncbi:MAG: SIS domain-containing protein [Spirochaetes bacterium]|nr:SIS domain-containing protein [Spirochaetota bacterium]
MRKEGINQSSRRYYRDLIGFLNKIVANDRSGREIDFHDAVHRAVEMILALSVSGNKCMFIGNGASQSISSHISTDLLKNGGIRTMAFTDPSLLTTFSNDFGYEYVFQKPLELHADKGDIVIAISSSGKSINILNACRAARERECSIITMSGFRPDNPLKGTGDINFFVPVEEYGPVEVIHHSICHCLVDMILESNADAER